MCRSVFVGLFAWGLVLMLPGCMIPSQNKQVCPQKIDSVYLHRLANQSHWTLRGRVVWLPRGKSGAQKASIFWQQTNRQDYIIRLLGPLGVGGGQLVRENNRVIWREGRKQVTADSADQLVWDNLGLRLPVEQLSYWIRGLPGRQDKERRVYDQQDRLQQINGAEFVVNLSEYRCIQGTWMLPTHLDVLLDQEAVHMDITTWHMGDESEMP